MQKAFTLIELLVTMAIIAILMALGSVAMSSARKSSQQTQCLHNLKSVGVAINLYVTDHEGQLPGPTYNAQKSMPDNRYFLASYLGPYLGHPEITYTPGKQTQIEAFHCPCTTWSELGYRACHQMKQGSIGNQDPWGDPRNETAPMLVAQVAAITPLSRQWALRDNWGAPPQDDPRAGSAGPARHGKTSVLYFDGHVAAE